MSAANILGFTLTLCALTLLAVYLGASWLTVVVVLLVYFALWFCGALWRAYVSAPKYKTNAYNHDGEVWELCAWWWCNWEVVGTAVVVQVLMLAAVELML